MHLLLTSISRKVLDTDGIESVTIPTKQGVITVFPGHEPLISALNPGVLTVRRGGQDESYAIGGGVVEIADDLLTISADMIEAGESIDLDLVRQKKQEAHAMLEEARKSGATMDMDRYVELEYELLKESAKEQLATR